MSTERAIIMRKAAEQVESDDFRGSSNMDVHDLVASIARELCYDFNLRVNLIALKHENPKMLQDMIDFFFSCKRDRTKS
jgi:hypothetical protein